MGRRMGRGVCCFQQGAAPVEWLKIHENRSNRLLYFACLSLASLLNLPPLSLPLVLASLVDLFVCYRLTALSSAFLHSLSHM